MAKSKVIGIDLGTTNSVVAVMENGQPTVVVNQSADIHRLCGQALDRLGVAWRFSKPNTISVARRTAVARLDVFVGPKY